jgi:hypothetical protein
MVAERNVEEPLNNEDQVFVKKIVRDSRFLLIIISVILFILYWFSPFMLGRGRVSAGDQLINQMPYYAALIWFFPFMILPPLIYFFSVRKLFSDSKNGVKMTLHTQITELNRSDRVLKIKVSNSEFLDKWIIIKYFDRVDRLEVNDLVTISLLPKSKMVIECKKLIDNNN